MRDRRCIGIVSCSLALGRGRNLAGVGHGHAHRNGAAGDCGGLGEDVERCRGGAGVSIQIRAAVVQGIDAGGDAVGKLIKRSERSGDVLVPRREDAPSWPPPVASSEVMSEPPTKKCVTPSTDPLES